MSFDNLRLSESVIERLYRSVLVENDPSKRALQPDEIPENGFKYLGKNSKQVAVIVNTPNHGYLDEGDLQFLSKILLACKLNLGDIALVNTSNKPVTSELLHEELSPLQMILLGVDPSEIHLPFNFPPFKNQAHGNCTYLHAPAISELNKQNETAKSLKSKLWFCLKAMFNV